MGYRPVVKIKKILSDSSSPCQKTPQHKKSAKFENFLKIRHFYPLVSVVFQTPIFQKSLNIDTKTWVSLKKTDWIVFVIHPCLLLKKNFIENKRKMPILDAFFERQQLIIQPNILVHVLDFLPVDEGTPKSRAPMFLHPKNDYKWIYLLNYEFSKPSLWHHNSYHITFFRFDKFTKFFLFDKFERKARHVENFLESRQFKRGMSL